METTSELSVHDESTTLKRALSYVEGLGFPIPSRPISAHIEWPGNVADLDSQSLAQHLTYWSAWSGRARYMLALAETNYTAFSSELEVNEKKYLFKSKGDYKTVTELKAAVHQLPTMVELTSKVLRAEAEKKIIKALLEGYESKYFTVSREISRRKAEFGEIHE